MARITRTLSTPAVDLARQYMVAKLEEKSVKERMAELKTRIFAAVDEDGTEDDKGSLFIPVDPDSGVKEITKQRRVSVSVDQDKLEALLREKGLYEECTKTVVMLDDDKVNAAVYEQKISEAEFADCVSRKVTWALVVK